MGSRSGVLPFVRRDVHVVCVPLAEGDGAAHHHEKDNEADPPGTAFLRRHSGIAAHERRLLARLRRCLQEHPRKSSVSPGGPEGVPAPNDRTMTTRALVSFVTGLVLVAALFVSPLTAGVASAAPSAQLDNAAAVDAYAHVLQKINPQLRSGESHWLAAHVLTNANRWRIDANLLVALVTVESAWRTQARSHVGAI